ncbi:MAG: dihydroorotate dehydrogenase electron transfer subunit [Candidatus Omnitrophica bacterium]|nr:dihydroorotate dehydrogenase electron transfer subunit [Candidatus Omnitrophota bacterium]
MKQLAAKLISNKKVKGNYWHCVIDAPFIAKKASPGQFLNIKLSDSFDPLLRRPFSIHNCSAKKVEILYEVLGKGTQILSQKKPGETLDIIGPIGKGFDYKAGSGQIIVAGGMGVAPLVFLAKVLAKSKPRVFLGARTKEQILCAKELKALGLYVEVSTDDGTAGFKGKITELLRNNISSGMIYACGPKAMLKAVAEFSSGLKIPAQLSLEEHMSCAIGVCLGCVVKTKAGLKRVCKEGPVFNAADLIW